FDITIVLDPPVDIDLTLDNACVVEGAYSVTVDFVNVTDIGVAPYTISVDGSAPQSIPGIPHTITNLNSGAHTVIITDVNGCSDTANITIDAPLDVLASVTAQPTCADNDGVVTATGSGGSGIYTFDLLDLTF